MASKITQLTENTNPASTDIIEMVDDPAGTSLNQRTTFANATKALSVMVGDSGSGGTKGLVPAPAAGDAAANKFLRADGTFDVVTGTPPAAHAVEHENGGGDEIDVTGLSGFLADPQVADKIVETSGPTTLDIGDIADGEFLKRVGGEIVSDSVPGGAEAGANSDITSMDGLTGALETPTRIDFAEGVAPGTPGAGKVSLYAKADGLLYSKDDAGAETALGGGGGGGSPGGSDGDIQYRVDASTFGGSQLKRIDANTLDIKNGATAQVLRLYQTDDGAGNYGRIALQVASNVYVLASEKGGTGSIRSIGIKIDTALYTFSGTSFVPPSSGNQELGTTTLRWGQFSGTNINLANNGEFRWNGLTRFTVGVDGFPVIIADAGIGSNCGWIFGRNDTNGVRLRRVSTVLETRLGGDSDYAVHVAGGFRVAERSADPSAADLTSGANAKDRAQIYMKGDKFVVAYNDGAGTVNYLAIPLDGSTTTWTNSTSAP